MFRFRFTEDPDECRALWQEVVLGEFVTDLWEFRACFHQHYARRLHFVVAEADGPIAGLLPLTWIEEVGCYGYFPGETWHGKTWIEQNRVWHRGNGAAEGLLANCPSVYHLRYLLPPGPPALEQCVDEIGYLFLPPKYDYDLENYFQEFSHRHAKRLKRDLDAFDRMGATYRRQEFSDFEHLVRMNVERFGDDSYFHDRRFLESFRSLAHFLHERGWFRMTAILIGGEVAAVDLGCVYRGVYTLLGGGTNGNYPGIAKLINVHHLRVACEERLQSVDFLCGDFQWKTLFRLTPRPLYLLSNVPAEPSNHEDS